MKAFPYFLMFFFLLPAVGCAPRMASSGGGGQVSLVKIFTKTDGGTLYFAGPMAYRSTETSDEISIDFSLNKPKDGEQGEVTCNFTLITATSSEFKPSLLQLGIADAMLIEVTEFEKFFSEIRKKRYHFRYSVVVAESIWVKWIESDKHRLVLNGQTFVGGKRHTKDLKEVRERVVFPLK
jgi:hypothetical protein